MTSNQAAVQTNIQRIETICAEMPFLSSGNALVQIRMAGICGSDVHLYRSGHIGNAVVNYPFILGHECVGVVTSVFDENNSSLIGKRVAVNPTISCRNCKFCLAGSHNLCPHQTFLGLPPTPGALQAYISHPVVELAVLPSTVTDEEAVLLEPLAIAMHAVELSRAKAGRSAAILGCGPMGLCSLMLLKHLGCRPILATDILDYRLKAAQTLGADIIINPQKHDIPLLDGGYHAVIEAAGAEQTQQQMVQIASPGAKIAVIGAGENDIIAFESSVARRKGLSIMMVRRSRNTLQRCIDLAESKKIPLSSLATHHFELNQCDQAFQCVMNYRDDVIKAMILF